MKDRLIKKFEDEIQALDRELKLELPKEIKRARELGDLRENAEYQAAKERQRLVEARISMLQKRVSEIALMNIDRIPTDRAGFGSTLARHREHRREARLPARDARGRGRREGHDLDDVADRPRVPNKEAGDIGQGDDARRHARVRDRQAARRFTTNRRNERAVTRAPPPNPTPPNFAPRSS